MIVQPLRTSALGHPLDPSTKQEIPVKDSEKNRCPEKARKRAGADARCALRKLGLLDRVAEAMASGDDSEAAKTLRAIGEALGLGGERCV